MRRWDSGAGLVVGVGITMVDLAGLEHFDDEWINPLVHKKPTGSTALNWLWRSTEFGTKLSGGKN
jgi:hypothetical protein